mmetsp:Transcript_23976/g.42480  ORF Transcript_23976/g.42480 Transcript_23976/m.42480 type:complete len:204 (+) Transcript_23976:2139-2750(+)
MGRVLSSPLPLDMSTRVCSELILRPAASLILSVTNGSPCRMVVSTLPPRCGPRRGPPPPPPCFVLVQRSDTDRSSKATTSLLYVSCSGSAAGPKEIEVACRSYIFAVWAAEDMTYGYATLSCWPVACRMYGSAVMALCSSVPCPTTRFSQKACVGHLLLGMLDLLPQSMFTDCMNKKSRSTLEKPISPTGSLVLSGSGCADLV